MYSISELSEILSISKDTLRYYDKIDLFKPKRGENKYRYYTEKDLLELKYIEVMKYAGLSLSEIKMILQNKAEESEESKQNTLKILCCKREELLRAISLYKIVLQIADDAIKTIEDKNHCSDIGKINSFVSEIYTNICKEENVK